ncbi:hypothetical protein SCHPADRAFT_903692 [Schizopora paradoxa]|uniref:Uncharacterized protein n=1 Tax=Schizopora paradoxa TaxID=27342 RepID=A0A0H2RQ01_9AGAM|nr:hypothetical protein SCHPADRAFT_903692 [Schizopora paradoxa]
MGMTSSGRDSARTPAVKDRKLIESSAHLASTFNTSDDSEALSNGLEFVGCVRVLNANTHRRPYGSTLRVLFRL